VASITERFSLLAAFPYAGRARGDLRPGLRSFSVGDYVILYRIEREDVVILPVIHGRRDIEATFRA
jgi:toxin ParE1/3/4